MIIKITIIECIICISHVLIILHVTSFNSFHDNSIDYKHNLPYFTNEETETQRV